MKTHYINGFTNIFKSISTILDTNPSTAFDDGGIHVMLPEEWRLQSLPEFLLEKKVSLKTIETKQYGIGQGVMQTMKGNGKIMTVKQILAFQNPEIRMPNLDDAGDLERFFNEFAEEPPQQFRYAAAWKAPKPAEDSGIYSNIYKGILESAGILHKLPGKPGQTKFVVCFAAPDGLSSFCLHREAEFVFSINVNLYGSPKLWLFIPIKHEREVIELGKIVFGDDFANCANPLSHFCYFFAPRILKENNIPFTIKVQRPGEVIVTTGLHQGINLGSSFCFAGDFGHINFISTYMERGQTSQCKCPGDSNYYFDREQQFALAQLTGKERRKEQTRENVHNFRQRQMEAGGPSDEDKAKTAKRQADFRKKPKEEKKKQNILNLDNIEF